MNHSVAPAVCESAQLRAHGGGSSGSSNSNGDGGDDYFSKIIDSYGPELSQISMGGIFGFCSGILGSSLNIHGYVT